MIQERQAVFRRSTFHKAGCKGRATCTSVGEAVDVTCTEHNHPPNQTSNNAKKPVSFMRKGQYTLTVIIEMSLNWTFWLAKYNCSLPPARSFLHLSLPTSSSPLLSTTLPHSILTLPLPSLSFLFFLSSLIFSPSSSHPFSLLFLIPHPHPHHLPPPHHSRCWW